MFGLNMILTANRCIWWWCCVRARHLLKKMQRREREKKKIALAADIAGERRAALLGAPCSIWWPFSVAKTVATCNHFFVGAKAFCDALPK